MENQNKVYVVFEIKDGNRIPVSAHEKYRDAENVVMNSTRYACVEKHDPCEFVRKRVPSAESARFDPIRFTVIAHTMWAELEFDLGNMMHRWFEGSESTDWFATF